MNSQKQKTAEELCKRRCCKYAHYGHARRQKMNVSHNLWMTHKVTSLFYSVQYVAYQQTYDVRSSYEFGIAELQSYCKCDCPEGENFCTYKFDRQRCSKGEICITRFHDLENSEGCANSGPSTLCCEISVSPYQNRRFSAISLVDPRPQTQMEIEIYAQFEQKWSLFRKYRRTILPYRANTLRLNGFENVAELYVRATMQASRYFLKNGDKWYFYELATPKFQLIDDRRINGLYERDANKFGWLRFENRQWTVGNPLVTLYDLQRPLVTNCKKQKYTDIYDMDFASVVVIRNNTGSINAVPILGVDVSKKQTFVDSVQMVTANFASRKDTSLVVTFTPSAAPTLALNMKLHQKMSIIGHMYASYLEDFTAAICLDKYRDHFINCLTLFVKSVRGRRPWNLSTEFVHV